MNLDNAIGAGPEAITVVAQNPVSEPSAGDRIQR